MNKILSMAIARDVDEFGLPIIAGRQVIIDGTGTIDRVASDGLIINDAFYGFASTVQFFSEKNTPVSLEYFTRGDSVGFRMGENGGLMTLWKLPERNGE